MPLAPALDHDQQWKWLLPRACWSLWAHCRTPSNCLLVDSGCESAAASWCISKKPFGCVTFLWAGHLVKCGSYLLHFFLRQGKPHCLKNAILYLVLICLGDFLVCLTFRKSCEMFEHQTWLPRCTQFRRRLDGLNIPLLSRKPLSLSLICVPKDKNKINLSGVISLGLYRLNKWLSYFTTVKIMITFTSIYQ